MNKEERLKKYEEFFAIIVKSNKLIKEHKGLEDKDMERITQLSSEILKDKQK